jgi:hypothetical protein
MRKNRGIAGNCGLAVGKGRPDVCEEPMEWLPKMACNFLAVWIEAFGPVELAQPCVYARIP